MIMVDTDIRFLRCPTLDSLRHALHVYQEKYRHPTRPRLECSDLYALFPEGLPSPAKKQWPDTWPYSERSGVYLIFSRTGKLLYVGKAWAIGSRLSTYFQYDSPRRESRTCKIVHDWRGDEQPFYVATVAVPTDSIFEAAALEEFLIGELKPSENKTRLREVVAS